MTDFAPRYSGSVVTDSVLNGASVVNGATLAGDDYTADRIVQRRFVLEVVFGSTASQGVTFFFQGKDGANYSSNTNAYHKVMVAPVANSTERAHFIAISTDCPKDYRINVDNPSGADVTVTVKSETALFTDTLT